jgi:MFS transporter, DHA2 family, multidrug resistance protein
VTRHNPWAVAMTVTLATFMEVLDTSIANVSLPHIAGNLSEGTDAATWILTSYLVANAVVLPLSGWLANLIGRKRFYMICVALFSGSSLLCGLAPNLSWLIIFRLMQGLGGGGLQPSEQAILADTFPEEKRGMAFAVYGMAVVLAPAIGPTLGGFITDTTSWRWIFFINVPVGIVSLFLTSRLVEVPPVEKRTGFRIDYIGLGLIVTGIGCLQILLDKGERDDWFSSGLMVFLAVAAAICIVAVIVWEWRHAHPILELRLLAVRNLGMSFLMMFVLGFVLFATTVLLPLFLQTLLGYTAMRAGETLSPGGIVVILLLPLVGALLGKIDARWLIGFGFLSTALAMFHMTGLSLDIDFRTAMLYRIYQSIGLAFLFVPINTIAYVGVAPGKNNQVSALLNLARNIGGSVGISLATTMLARRTQVHRARLVEHVTPFDAQARAALAAAERMFVARGYAAADATRRAWAALQGSIQRQAATLAYLDIIWWMAAIALAMLPLVFLLRRSKGRPATAH